MRTLVGGVGVASWVARTCTLRVRAFDATEPCVLYVKGYESPLRQVLQCGRPPGCAQAAAPAAVGAARESTEKVPGSGACGRCGSGAAVAVA